MGYNIDRVMVFDYGCLLRFFGEFLENDNV